MNTYLPGLVAERFRGSRIVAFSTGNVYPPRPPVASGGADEVDATGPSASTPQSASAASGCSSTSPHRYGTRMAIIRLNYAVELRYGVLARHRPCCARAASRSTSRWATST